MQLSHCFFAGVPTAQAWTQAFVRLEDDGLFGVVVHVESPVFDPAGVGKSIIAACVQAQENGNFKREQFLNFFGQWHEAGIDITAVWGVEETVFVYAQGKTKIWLVRGNQEGAILAGTPNGTYLEGKLQLGDYYTLATENYFAHFPSLNAALSPQENCDKSVAKLHEFPDSSSLGAIFLQVKDEAVETVVAAETASSVVHTSLPEAAAPVRQLKLPTFNSASSFAVLRRKYQKAFRAVIVLVVVGLALFIAQFVFRLQQARHLEQVVTPYQQRFATIHQNESDRFASLKALTDLKNELTAQLKTNGDTNIKRNLTVLLAKVQADYDQLSGEKHIDKLNVFFDFRLIAADFVASALDYDTAGKLAVVLDSTKSRVLSLSLENKEAIPMSVGDALTHPFDISIQDRQAYILGDNGIMQLSLPLDKVGSVVVARDSNWQQPKIVSTFGTNAYVLDTEARNLWRYDLTNPTASPSGWLRSKEGLDFNNITSMRIDGGVWFGNSDGKISHFLQGGPAKFTYQNFIEAPSSSLSLFTTPDSDAIYALEPRAKRLVEMGKDGSYRRAITSDDLATATAVIVDEPSKKAYILAGSLIYQVDL